MTFLVGENGAGKTTTFKVLLGEIRPESGEVRLPRTRNRRIGYCPQTFTLPGQVSVTEYLHYLGWLRAMTRAELVEAVPRAIDVVGLRDQAHERLGRLSGGMRQRVGLAQAVIGAPSLVLLDEPTAGLDPMSRVLVRESLTSIAESAHVIISTHLLDDLELLGAEADLVVLSRGQVTYAGQLDELTLDGPRLERATARESAVIRAMHGPPR